MFALLQTGLLVLVDSLGQTLALSPNPNPNQALTEAMVLAMLFDSGTKGQVRPMQMILLALIAAGLAVCAGLLSRAVFRWGNRGRRRLVTHPRLDPSPIPSPNPSAHSSP